MNNKQCTFDKRSVFDRFIPTNGHWDLDKLKEELQGSWNDRKHCKVCYDKWHHLYKYVIGIFDYIESVEDTWQMFDEYWQIKQIDELEELPW